LIFEINEVEPIAHLVAYGSETNFLTKEGRLIPINNSYFSEFETLPIVYDRTVVSNSELKPVFDNIINLIQRSVTLGSSISFPLITLQKESGVLKITAQSSQGWQAFFIPGQDFLEQIDNLVVVWRERLKDQNNLEYIDLRFGNKVFYK